MSGSYTVRAGDTLSAIAARNQVSLAQLEAANAQIGDPDLIHPGDRITLPGGGGQERRPTQVGGGAANTPTSYRIERGDTLSRIADRFRTSVAALAERNGIDNPNLIQVGATLVVSSSGGGGTPPQSRRAADHQHSGSSGGDTGVRANARLVARIARETGADPVTAVSIMLVESGGDERAVGDGGTSFGLFQLHRGGMLTAAGLTKQQAFDPATNARVAVASLARTEDARGRSGGGTAAASQRPADPAGYARKVDAQRDRAAALMA